MLESHHSQSTLPSRVRRRLLGADMANQGGAWKCTSCHRQCAKSAEYCPGCGQHWSATAEGYTARQPWTQGWQGRADNRQWPKSPRKRPPRARQPSGFQTPGQGGGKGPKGSKGGGKAGVPEPARPSVEMLPSMPSGAAVGLPKGGTTAPSSASASLEKTQLEALTGCLAAIKDTLPAEVRDTLDRLQLATSASNTKDMHRAVAAQAQAKKQLLQVQTARASYLEAWNAYVGQVTQLLKKQVEEQASQLEAYDEAELQWSGSLEQTTTDLARLTRNSASTKGEQEEMELENEDLVDSDIRTARELELKRESQLAESQKLVAMMENIQQTATKQLKQEGRDGSRTPRRKSREGDILDLTKEDDEGKSRGTKSEDKAAAKATPQKPPPA